MINEIMEIMIKKITILFFALALTGNLTGQKNKQENQVNVIILIGDGMGLSHFSVPYYYQDKEPVFSQFKHIGLVRTSSATHTITESAAAATAMFMGRKTYNSAIGVDSDTVAHKNLVEVLSELGYQTGVISTSSITDATPAGFYAHEDSRDNHRAIARDLVHSEIDFFAGGGLKHFVQTSGEDLFKKNNLYVDFSRVNKIRKPKEGTRYGYLLAFDAMPAMLDERGDFLPKATKIALDYFSNSEKGFLLMVEGSQIDWAAHSNNPDYLITEMNDFEETVKVAYDFAAKDGNTLVIVTADHETGGFTLAASGSEKTYADYDIISPSFATSNHSASLVPLLAFGPGAETFAGIYHNIAIYYKVIDLVNGSVE
jgi:alkaline phosphatase